MEDLIRIIFNYKNILKNSKGDFKTLVVIIITVIAGVLFLLLVVKMIGKYV